MSRPLASRVALAEVMAGGGLVHPPPADQYVPSSGGQFSNAGIGNDWGVFTVFANTETGLTPLQAQGPGLEFSTVLPKRLNPVEITGYGVSRRPTRRPAAHRFCVEGRVPPGSSP